MSERRHAHTSAPARAEGRDAGACAQALARTHSRADASGAARLRQRVRTWARALALPVGAMLAASAHADDGCSNLDAQPPTFAVSYQSIQFIFLDNGCTECHESHVACDPEGEATTPSAQLDLCPGASWFNLVNVASSQSAALTRVVPNQPLASLLFSKVHCDTPALGWRMPVGFPQLSDYDQALVHDWIAGGAPLGITDTIFRGQFEPRG